MVNKVIDLYLKDYLVYHYDGWYWVIHPDTKEWVVNLADSGYTFFNSDFWVSFSMFYPLCDLTNDIRNWVVYKMGVPISKHCYPDYIHGNYDWRDEFSDKTIDEVLSDGELICSCKHDPSFEMGPI